MKLNELKHYSGFLLALALAKLKKRKVPLIAIVGVTNKCNLDCWYCYGEHHYRSGCREFTTKELLEMIHSLSRLGTRIIQFQGGEPLLRDDLRDIILQARNCGMCVDMVTNGTLISRKAQTVSLLDRICVSLDGPRESNDRNRGEGSHEKAVAGIKLARSFGLPVRLSSVLTAESTIEDIDWLIDFARGNKVKLNFSPSFDFVPRFRMPPASPHAIPDERLRLLLRHIMKHKLNNAPIQFTTVSYAVASRWPFSYKKRTATLGELAGKFPGYKCYHGDLVVFIDSDGSTYPCCNFWGRPGKNIFKDGLKGALSELSREGCAACYIPAYIDRNLFFDICPRAWLNYLTEGIKDIL